MSFTHQFIPGDGSIRTTLLLLHGTGGNESDLVPLGQTLLPGAAILSPRGKVLEHGMPRFFRRLAEGVFDLEDLRFRARELADFVLESAGRYQFDVDSLTAIGYSNGANIASAMLLLRPETLAAAVLFRAMIPFVPESMPSLKGKRALISSGRADPIMPPEQPPELARMLEEAGAEVTLHWQNAAHGLVQADLTLAAEWLRNSTGAPA